MNYAKTMKAYDLLADDESRMWFDARVNHALKKDPVYWWEYIHEREWSFYGADIEFLSAPAYEGKKFVIFGAGTYGKHALFILQHSPLAGRVAAFVDNISRGGVQGIPCLKPHDLMKSPEEYVVIIGSDVYGLAMYRQLCFMKFPQSNIYMPREGRLVGLAGRQYFDVFSPAKNEVFVDAGCFDGRTSLEFVDWCHKDYQSIYAFEPTPDMAEICRKTFTDNKIDNCNLYEKVCWSSKGNVEFTVSTTRGASCVTGENGGMETISIDEVLSGKPVTFIKMDVEGSELEALKGAKKSILKYKPRLAISLYHKPEDIFELPAYIADLNEEYRLYIRHYTSDIWETVLYAV